MMVPLLGIEKTITVSSHTPSPKTSFISSAILTRESPKKTAKITVIHHRQGLSSTERGGGAPSYFLLLGRPLEQKIASILQSIAAAQTLHKTSRRWKKKSPVKTILKGRVIGRAVVVVVFIETRYFRCCVLFS